jgi:hypothetical protein
VCDFKHAFLLSKARKECRWLPIFGRSAPFRPNIPFHRDKEKGDTDPIQLRNVPVRVHNPVSAAQTISGQLSQEFSLRTEFHAADEICNSVSTKFYPVASHAGTTIGHSPFHPNFWKDVPKAQHLSGTIPLLAFYPSPRPSQRNSWLGFTDETKWGILVPPLSVLRRLGLSFAPIPNVEHLDDRHTLSPLRERKSPSSAERHR